MLSFAGYITAFININRNNTFIISRCAIFDYLLQTAAMNTKRSLTPSRITRSVSAKEFLSILNKNPQSIKSSKIKHPKLGSNNLDAKIIVELK